MQLDRRRKPRNTEAVALLYADQSLAELAASITGTAHSNGSPLTLLLHAQRLFGAGSAEAATELLVELLDDAVGDSRTKLWAAAALRERKALPPARATFAPEGIVVDLAAGEGRAVLAVYRDGTARVLCNAGGAVVYEGGRNSISALCEQLLAAAERIVALPKGAPLAPPASLVTVLTLNGPIVAGSQSPRHEPLELAAALIADVTPD